MAIEMREVGNPSSHVKAYGYDPEKRILRVTFKGRVNRDGVQQPDTTYELEEVPAEHYDGLNASGSAGSYYHTHLRRAGYKYRKIEE